MPTGVNCERLLAGLQWKDTIWRQGELKVGLAGWMICTAAITLTMMQYESLQVDALACIHVHRPGSCTYSIANALVLDGTDW